MNIKEEYLKNSELVTRKETSNPDLFVLKYRKKVFFNDLWNDFLRECRGLIIDKDWNVVSYPFTKIHNYGIEAAAPVLADEDMVFASRKVNGFMVAVTWVNNQLLWSTTGSIDSDFVSYAQDIYFSWTGEQRFEFRRIIRSRYDHTFMFECVHKKDPHIVDEEPGLYFLGCREKKFGSPVWIMDQQEESKEWAETGVKTVETYTCTMRELLEMVKDVKHEGFVFEAMDGDSVTKCSKLKSPYYLSKKALMRGNWEKFLNRNMRDRLDEEFYPLYDYIHEVERERFFELDEIARREYIEKWFRK